MVPLEARGEELVAIVGLVLLMLVIGIPWLLWQAEKVEKAWTGAAANLGLHYAGGVISGRMRDFDVVIRRLTRGSGKSTKSFTRIEFTGGLPADVGLAREGFLERARSPDATVGAPDFDHAVRIHGDGLDFVHALGAELREALRIAVASGWTLAEGVFACETPGTLTTDLEARIRDGLALAERLRTIAGDVGSHLALRVADDPIPAVRVGALRILVTRRFGAPVLAEGLGHARAAADPDLRFEAARFTDDGPALIGLAHEGHANALRALVSAPRYAHDLQEVLAAWITDGVRTTEAALALAEALGVVPTAGAERALVDLLSISDLPDHAVERAARAQVAVAEHGAVAAPGPLVSRRSPGSG